VIPCGVREKECIWIYLILSVIKTIKIIVFEDISICPSIQIFYRIKIWFDCYIGGFSLGWKGGSSEF
jgi:hypothetical protein